MEDRDHLEFLLRYHVYNMSVFYIVNSGEYEDLIYLRFDYIFSCSIWYYEYE